MSCDTMFKIMQTDQVSRRFHRQGFTLVELMISLISLSIIIAGIFFFISRQGISLRTSEAGKRITQRQQQIKTIIMRDLRWLGVNPKKVAFELDPLPTSPIDLTLTHTDCNVPFPVYDPNPGFTLFQPCFGILDARFYKLEFSGDRPDPGGFYDGDVANDEVRAFVLQREADNFIFDPLPQTDISGGPAFLSQIETPLDSYYGVDDLAFGGVLANRNYVPAPCTVTGTLNQRYRLMSRDYDATGNPRYRMLVDRVLCMGVLYFRPAHDYELCAPCFAEVPPPGSGNIQEVSSPAECSGAFPTVPPEQYFETQLGVAGDTPAMTQSQVDQKYVSMRFPAMTDALIPNDAYLAHVIRMRLIIEDDRIREGYVNPITNRAYETFNVDINYHIPKANLPCNVNSGSCSYNNEQCSAQ